MKRKILCNLVWVISLMMVVNLGLCRTAMGAGDVRQASIDRAVTYLQKVQNQDGGFPYQPGQASSPAVSNWVVTALVAAGEDVESRKWASGGCGPVAYIQNHTGLPKSTCDRARMLLCLAALEKEPVHAGHNLARELQEVQMDGGQFGLPGEEGCINAHIWSVIALQAAGYPLPDRFQARQWLLDSQNPDGGFSWYRDIESDADDTAAAIQALILLGEEPGKSSALAQALSYLHTCQNEDGGFSCGGLTGPGSNSCSSAWVLMGLKAAGQDGQGEQWTIQGKTAVAYLLELQTGAGGFNWMEDMESCPVQSTAYAIMALSGNSFIPEKAGHGGENTWTAKRFTDLPLEHPAAKAIYALMEKKVLSGYPEGTFRPDSAVTRAEFARMLVRTLDIKQDAVPEEVFFYDVPGEFWAYPDIALAASQNYIQGDAEGNFRPADAINGAELAAILVRAHSGLVCIQGKGAEWYLPFVNLARDQGLLYPEFSAQMPATRAQCAISLFQLQQSISL